ncbi:Protein kinase domain [seawater metagenome]|uniref:Protein kinase domain n=1 Tax=seawater metagenome TaxID=1561972 RepID=A0A5E8CI47_9ZZZZ
MTENLLKTGSCSIIIGKNHYSGYFNYKLNKLLKVTKILDNHNELSNMEIIRKIPQASQYFVIPDKEIFTIFPESIFYKYLQNITPSDCSNIFKGNLFCFYVDNAGTHDLLDSINDMNLHNFSNTWTSYQSILNFTQQIMRGLSFLHFNKICHLDIKPENIMINNNNFKIIDFGFSSIEPFDDFISTMKGTPGYFPKHFYDSVEPGMPAIKANDLEYVNGKIPMTIDRKLVYKIDSYCLGRVINLLMYHFQDITYPSCLCFPNSTKKKINKIKNLLLENDVNKRLCVSDILLLNLI